MIDKVKEDLFYKEEFKFSYSSLNRLLFSPKLFYRDYILKERELKTDKHLIEGKLLHLMLLQPEKLHDEFSIVPNKVPSDNVRKVLKSISNMFFDPHQAIGTTIKLDELDEQILEALKENNLYQSFKDDQKRIDKINTPENAEYLYFLCQDQKKDIIDNEMLLKATERVELIKANKDVMSLLMQEGTDWDLDNIKVYNEKKLECGLSKFKFGLKGIIDKYIIDDKTKTITIIDLKTTAKPLENFAETVDFYNYWLQAAVYSLLVMKNVDENQQDYKIIFKFVVIDKYDQVYVFPVSEETQLKWIQGLMDTLQEANYHYSERKYDLPYDFANGNVTL
tara:strand:+ start:904 stop:1911 length:1008 start_codon:yes stop_codon:yes gene_type:complete